MSPLENTAKRLLDLAVAVALLVGLTPVLLATALIIALDSPGPIFFRQERLGKGATRFRIWKFRTMRRDADVRIDPSGNVVNTAVDSRHTRVGRLLRKWSVDELPQLINVLVGEMSLVGPRPDLPEALSMYSEEERRRLEVRPGITGLAQATGRNALTPRQKWALDAQYVVTASFVGDLKILWATVRGVFGRRGIYG